MDYRQVSQGVLQKDTQITVLLLDILMQLFHLLAESRGKQHHEQTRRQVSQMKQASVYSYIYTVLTNRAAKPTLQEAMKALYLYGEAAKAYFASVN